MKEVKEVMVIYPQPHPSWTLKSCPNIYLEFSILDGCAQCPQCGTYVFIILTAVLNVLGEFWIAK